MAEQATQVDKKSERRSRFLRVAEKRTQITIKALQNLSKCGDQQNYSYRDGETRQIIKAIKKELAQMESAFAPSEEDAAEAIFRIQIEDEEGEEAGA